MSDPILREFPYSLETERLLIRGPLPGDGKMVRATVLESQNELKQWLPWAVDIPDDEAYEANIRRGHTRFLNREDLWLMILLKDTGVIIGGSGLHRIDWDVPKFEIGYWLGTPYTGKGYMTEAVEAISNFAFTVLGAMRVEIRVDSNNHKSIAIPKRLGFALEATLRNEARHHVTNELRDTLIFAKVRVEEGNR
ncbi:MAG: GNAT family N-acetyltransferase [Ardenticatenaceae bacterium]|nr:GNAT family N-acetyltransferase [Ardenticatenaceae bacterium]